MADNRSPAELPPNECTIGPIDVLEDTEARTKLRLYIMVTVLSLVLFIAALDQTIVATAIPTISASLHSATGYVWIGGAYLLANVAAGPIWTKCSDIWGRKPALLVAVCVFAVGSVLAAVSTSMRMLIAARALQGTAGGGLMSLVTITISDLFSVRRRAFFIGLLGVVWALAGSAGPLVGGALTQLASWRWCFWINVPVCVISFVLLWLCLDVHNPHTTLGDGLKAIDWFGTFSILALTILLLLGLDFGGAIFPWDSPKVICLIVFGTLMIAFFLFSEKRLARYPLMPLSVFRDWSNNALFLIVFAHSMVFIGIEYYLPLFFQSVKQVSPLRSGILIVPMMVTEAATEVFIGILIQRTGRYREFIWVGGALMTLGTGLYIAFRVDTSYATIIGFEIVGGIGTALLFQTPTVALQNTVSQADTASATSTLGFARNLGTALSIVIGGAVFQNGMTAQQSTLASAGLSPSVLKALSGDQAAANVDIVKTIQDPAQRQAIQEAFAWSLRNLFIMYTGLAAVVIVASIFVKRQVLSEEHTETKTGIQNMTERKN